MCTFPILLNYVKMTTIGIVSVDRYMNEGEKMADFKERKNEALEELKKIQEEDNASSLTYQEPELTNFDAKSVFDVEESEEKAQPKRGFRFGKRATRQASRVKVRSQALENNELDVEEVRLDDTRQKADPQPTIEQPAIRKEPVEPIEPEPVLEEKLPESQPVQEEKQTNEEESNTSRDFEVEYYVEGTQAEEGSEEVEEVPAEQEDQESSQDSTEVRLEDKDLYTEKQKFTFSEYGKVEKYLEKNSQDGFHFIRQEGKRFYFIEDEPKDYYYSLNYFKQEPTDQEKAQWEKDGWKIITSTPSKNKKEAGWFVMRNEEEPGEYRKTIDNDEEKFQFFRKHANSCRSTLFFIFICMVCCVVTGVLQVMYQGYIIGIAACVLLFIFALISYISYSRTLREAKHMASILKARLRIRKREKDILDEMDVSDDQLDSDWSQLDE